MQRARTLNSQLPKYRKQRHLTQAALADAIEVSVPTIVRWEGGKTIPRTQEMQRLCTYFGATPQELGFGPTEENTLISSAERPDLRVTSQEDRQQAGVPSPVAQVSHVAPIRPASLSVPRFSRRTLLMGIGILTGSTAIGIGAAAFFNRQERKASSFSSFSSPQSLTSGTVYTGHTNQVTSLVWHPHNDEYIASVDLDGVVRVWLPSSQKDLISFRCLTTTLAQPLVAWSPDGQLLAMSGDQGVYVLAVFPGGFCSAPYQGHNGAVNGCAWSPDGQSIASGGEDQTLQVWSVKTMHRRFLPIEFPSAVSTVDWSPDGNFILVGTEEGPIYLCDASTGRRTMTYYGHDKHVNTVAWPPLHQHQQFASVSDDMTIRVWKTTQANADWMYQNIDPKPRKVDAVAWSVDGRYLAAGCSDHEQQAYVWRASTLKRVYTCVGNSQEIHALAWSHSGYHLASAGSDHSVRIWDLAGPLG